MIPYKSDIDFTWGYFASAYVFEFNHDRNIQDMIDTLCWEENEVQLMRISDLYYVDVDDKDGFVLGYNAAEYAQMYHALDPVYEFDMHFKSSKNTGKVYFYGTLDSIQKRIDQIF